MTDEKVWNPSSSDPCPVCGHRGIAFNPAPAPATVVPFGAAWMMADTAPYGRCGHCGKELPPPTAAGHQCQPRHPE